MTKRILVAIALASAALGALAGNAMAASVAQVEALPTGTAGATLDQNPIITAILSQPGTVNGRTYTNYAVLANDGTGSLDVFGHLPAGNTYVPTVGDAITATGTYSPFDGIPELASLTAISQVSSGNAVPAIGTSTIPTLNNGTPPLSVVEYLWNLNNVTISSGVNTLTPGETFGATNVSLTVTDSSSNSMVMYYWPTSYSTVNANLNGSVIPTGPVDATGFVSTFDGVAEFNVVSITPVPEPASIVLFAMGLCGLAIWGWRRRQSCVAAL